MANKMIIGLESFPKRKRGNTIFKFESFCEADYPTQLKGSSFEENIRTILGFGSSETVAEAETKFWSFQLELNQHPQKILRLFVVEEDAKKLSPHWCQHCRSIGWGGHLICNKRFHFVLPRKEATPQTQGLNIEIHHNKHLMHGVLHSNGFGHLISLNGFAGGSEFISGRQVFSLWDRICTALRVRKISLTDMAERDGMELRLIHGVAFGKTWFNQWGYTFTRPTYGITFEMYNQSLATLQSFPLCLLIPHFTCHSKEIPFIIAKYQTISNQRLVTLGDLFKFMLKFKSRLPFNSVTPLNYHGVISENTGRWSAKRVEMAARVIVEALKRSEVRWVTRQEVRDRARAYIGDTGLLDFVLKSLGNHIVGNYVVRRMVNPVTKVLEYCLEDLSSVLPPSVNGNSGKIRVRLQMTKLQVSKDMFHLYRHILKEPGTSGWVHSNAPLGAIPMAVRMVLDTKHFVKDYQEVQERKTNDVIQNYDYVNLNCTIRVRNDGKGLLMKELPHENVSVSIHASIGELKAEVQRCFRRMYFGLSSFVAESVVGFNGLDSCSFYNSIRSKNCIVIEGRLDQICVNGVFEGGDNNIVVKCGCGATNEDGERLICCDICEGWQHSRCAGVPDSEEIPRIFLCNRCENDIVSLCPINFY
ncbi:hypothetical protein LUZ60_002785 [Juncus effusus]|nr:hypothetical protein LUZ60_002785 [Juncus effusus]